MAESRRAIIGIGCDPNRANFAKQQWAPVLDVDMDIAHSLPSLLEHVGKRRYEVFFIAPGMCKVFGEQGITEVTAKIHEMQPQIKSIQIRDVGTAIN